MRKLCWWFGHDLIVGATGGSFVPPVSYESRILKQRALASEDARQWHPRMDLDCAIRLSQELAVARSRMN